MLRKSFAPSRLALTVISAYVGDRTSAEEVAGSVEAAGELLSVRPMT
jgi:hypothetical protein